MAGGQNTSKASESPKRKLKLMGVGASLTCGEVYCLCAGNRGLLFFFPPPRDVKAAL